MKERAHLRWGDAYLLVTMFETDAQYEVRFHAFRVFVDRLDGNRGLTGEQKLERAREYIRTHRLSVSAYLDTEQTLGYERYVRPAESAKEQLTSRARELTADHSLTPKQRVEQLTTLVNALGVPNTQVVLDGESVSFVTFT